MTFRPGHGWWRRPILTARTENWSGIPARITHSASQASVADAWVELDLGNVEELLQFALKGKEGQGSHT